MSVKAELQRYHLIQKSYSSIVPDQLEEMCLLNTYYMGDTGIIVLKGLYWSKAEKLQSILLIRDDVCRYNDIYIYPCA